ncbi:MAG: mechanosensitive ion channel family protein [Actinomycetes bacterium]
MTAMTAIRLVAEQSTADEVVDYLDNTVLGSVVVLAVILVLALVTRWIWHRFVKRTTVTFTKSAVTRYLANDKDSPRDREMAIERYRARAAAVSAILTSTGTFIIVAVAVLFALSSIGVDVAPLLASAGIAGIAIGFGAQTIIRDFLSGVFMILENQYGVGDVVTVNGITGTVEDVGLRITTIRDFDGTVWYVANGSVTELGNRSQGWSVAVVDVPVAHSSDLEQAKDVLTHTVIGLQQDEKWTNRIMPDDPIVGVESITATAVTMRIRLHTVHEQQVPVARELRVRAIRALEAAAIQMPFSAPPPESPESSGTPGSQPPST